MPGHRRHCSVTVQAARCPRKRAISTAEGLHLLDAAPGDCQRLPTCQDSTGRKDVSVDPGLSQALPVVRLHGRRIGILWRPNLGELCSTPVRSFALPGPSWAPDPRSTTPSRAIPRGRRSSCSMAGPTPGAPSARSWPCCPPATMPSPLTSAALATPTARPAAMGSTTWPPTWWCSWTPSASGAPAWSGTRWAA
jgi:hypothetical protein